MPAADLRVAFAGTPEFARVALERLQAAGIHGMENPQWTPTWCHWQTTLARSGRFVFIPDGSRPLAAALPEQLGALG